MIFKNPLIKTKKDFDLIYKKGKSVNGSFFYLKYLDSKNIKTPSSFVVIIGTKVSKKSVLRNRKKRQLKEIIRLNKGLFKNGFLVLVIAKEEILKTDYNDLEKEFLELAKKAGITSK